MSLLEMFAKLEGKARPKISTTEFMTEDLKIKLFSDGRRPFLYFYDKERPEKREVPKELERTLWGLKFRSSLINAAGIFKNGDCYEVSYLQGAGGYVGGTTTWNPRKGKEIFHIKNPMRPFPLSEGSMNTLGLPSIGLEKTLPKIKKLFKERKVGFSEFSTTEYHEDSPVLWSVSLDDSIQDPNEALEKLDSSITLMQPFVDGFELNESCPNTESRGGLAERLAYISETAITGLPKPTLIIPKFSNDTPIEQIPYIMGMLFELGYSGINLGNTSKDYLSIRNSIHSKERAAFDFYTKNFEGGYGGAGLKEKSLALSAAAVKYRDAHSPDQEFHIIRTGGISTGKDLRDSDSVGVSLNQWFTGMWRRFEDDGHNLYKKVYEDLEAA